MMSSAATTVLPGAIYDELRARIISQAEAPGATVTESAIALRFGVARPTAKLAIERLVAEGLLRREAHRAARVPELTTADIDDLYTSRAIVEAAAVARLDGIPAAALAAQRALIASGADFAQHDIAFHRALVAGQSSGRLARMHDLIMGEVELCIGQVQSARLLSATEVAHQHQGILDAVLAGDHDRASTLTREHVEISRAALLAHRINS